MQKSTSRVIYDFGEHAPKLPVVKHLYPTIEYVQGIKISLDILPTIEADERNLVVLDEQMSEPGKFEDTSKPFTKETHNRNIKFVYIVLNAFDMWKVHRTISLNSHYKELFKNPRDEGQMRSLDQKVFPTKVNFFMDSFRVASKKDHASLLLDGEISHPRSGKGAHEHI